MNELRALGGWSYCYHVTAERNLPSIRAFRSLLPAALLLEKAERSHLVRSRRTGNLQLLVEGREIILRNQIALEPECVEFHAAETLEEYVACLNARVFFWPGMDRATTADGLRMFQRTAEGTPIMIRARCASLLAVNASIPVYLANCNTGASWISEGKKSRRGAAVFQPMASFSEHTSNIEEISFVGPVRLPPDSEYTTEPFDTWNRLL